MTTASGVIVTCGGFPAVACQASFDEGFSFRLYVIDVQVVGGQGGIIELEPDLVMYVYSAGYEEPNLRSQRFRVERGAGRLVAVPSVGDCCPEIV